MWFGLTPGQVNLALNLLGVLLGGGALGVVLSHFRGMRQLTGQDEADIRGHWAAEVKALRERLDASDKRYMDLIRTFDEYREQANERYKQATQYHDDCVAERNELRNEIEGLKAQIRAQATDRVLLMEENCGKPSETAPHSLAAAQRLKGKQQ